MALAPPPGVDTQKITAFLPSGVAPAPGSVLDGKTLLAKKDARNKAAIAADDAALAFRAKLTVKLQCRLDLGGQWKLVGSSPELGRWTPEIAPTMTWSEGDVWSTTLTLRPGRHYFKAVMRRADGCYVYEDAPERYVDVSVVSNSRSRAAAPVPEGTWVWRGRRACHDEACPPPPSPSSSWPDTAFPACRRIVITHVYLPTPIPCLRTDPRQPRRPGGNAGHQAAPGLLNRLPGGRPGRRPLSVCPGWPVALCMGLGVV